MGVTYIVAPGCEFNYPADEQSLNLIQAAGGRSKLTDADREQINYKVAREGDDCSDLPPAALELYLERGQVLLVDDNDNEVASVESPDGTGPVVMSESVPYQVDETVQEPVTVIGEQERES
jgi:hypothetical protein